MEHAIVNIESGEIIGKYQGKLTMKNMEFVLFFGKNLLALERSKPTKKDIILGEILLAMDNKNIVNLTLYFKLPLSKKINVHITYISKVIKELEEKKVLHKVNRGIYLVNPYLYGKGGLNSISKLRWEFEAIFTNEDVNLSYEITKIYNPDDY